MGRFRAIVAVLALLMLAAWAAEPRVAMVLEVKGEVSAVIDGRAKPLRTLQTLPRDLKITVGKGGVLRLTYTGSARREVITGPLSLTVGESSSQAVQGEGKLAVAAAESSSTRVPPSENLRRMGGARHAMLDLSPLQVLEGLEVSPAPGIVRNTRMPIVRTEPKLAILAFPPAVRKLTPGLKLRWKGGKSPYRTTLTRDEGQIVLEVEDTKDLSLALKGLEGGYSYTLTVRDAAGAQTTRQFYLLSRDERHEVGDELEALAQENRQNKTLLLTTQVAYLESLGLFEDALPLAQQAVRRAPEDAGLALALGRLQAQLGQTEKAEKTLERAIQLEAKGARP